MPRCVMPQKRSKPLAITCRLIILLLPMFLLVGCASNKIKRKDGSSSQRSFSIAGLAKCDIDRVTEFVEKEALKSLRLLTQKLYLRNPQEFRKQGLDSAQAATKQLFGELEHWANSPMKNLDWQENFKLSFVEDYTGDRVYTFMSALLTMVMASYDHKQTFFFCDSLDAQKLYNSARNIETAVWKLSNAKLTNGQPYLFTNSMEGTEDNLSFEREFGKLLADQDLMALIIEGKKNRLISRVVTSAASFIFLPI